MVGYFGHRLIAALERIVPASAKRVAKAAVPGIDHAYYAWLHRTTRPGEVETTIRGGPLQGRKFKCSLRNERHYWLGTWEPDAVEFANTWVKPGSIVFDVGVHRGYFTLLAALLAGDRGRVVAFEPAPENRKITHFNLSQNRDLERRIVLEAFAISESRGRECFECGDVGSSTAGLSRTRLESGKNTCNVETISLDEYVGISKLKPTVIKMDIEGAEKYALVGASTLLKTIRPVLLIEIHDAECAAVLQSMMTNYQYVARRDSDETYSGRVSWRGRAQYSVVPTELAAPPLT